MITVVTTTAIDSAISAPVSASSRPGPAVQVAKVEAMYGASIAANRTGSCHQRAVAGEVVGVVVIVVGVAVMLDVDEPQPGNEISGETNSIAARPNTPLTHRLELIE